jgi:hypothetical protein
MEAPNRERLTGSDKDQFVGPNQFTRHAHARNSIPEKRQCLLNSSPETKLSAEADACGWSFSRSMKIDSALCANGTRPMAPQKRSNSPSMNWR